MAHLSERPRGFAEGIDRRMVGGFVLVGIVVLYLQILGFRDLRHDDAFISYRYGQNLANGLGFVFNPGEWVMGSTSPGHALLAALLYRLVGETALPAVMAVLGCVAWTAQAAALLLILGPAVGWWTGLFVAMCVAAGAAASYDWVALETNATMALALWAVALAFRSRWLGAALLCALAGLMRPDAYLLALPLGLSWLPEVRVAGWRPIVVGAAVTVPWFAFATWYFGTPIPQSAITKIRHVETLAYARHLLTHLPATVYGGPPALSVAAWMAALAGAVVFIRRDARLSVLGAYGLLNAVAYLYLRPFTAYTWHIYPAVVMFAVFSLGGLAAGGWLVSRVLSPTVVPAAFALVVILFGLRSYAAAIEYPHAFWFGARDAAYRRVAEHLVKFSDMSDVVASAEVGTIGYHSHSRMYDLAGLVTRNPHKLLPSVGEQITPSIDGLPGLRWLVLPPHWMMWRIPPSAEVWIVQDSAFRIYLIDLKPRGGSS